jgi:hypothetical protein
MLGFVDTGLQVERSIDETEFLQFIPTFNIEKDPYHSPFNTLGIKERLRWAKICELAVILAFEANLTFDLNNNGE